MRGSSHAAYNHNPNTNPNPTRRSRACAVAAMSTFLTIYFFLPDTGTNAIGQVENAASIWYKSYPDLTFGMIGSKCELRQCKKWLVWLFVCHFVSISYFSFSWGDTVTVQFTKNESFCLREIDAAARNDHCDLISALLYKTALHSLNPRFVVDIAMSSRICRYCYIVK